MKDVSVRKEFQIWQFIAERLEQKQNVILLVVAESSGSSPGRQGFKMAVAEDDLMGSIGGGVMEVSLVEQARSKSKVRSPKFRVFEQVHRKGLQNSSGMICSGEQTVILFELGSEHLNTVQEIISALENRDSGKLRLTNHDLRITNHGSADSEFKFEQKIDNEFLFEESLGFKNKLFVVGGGHCALALTELISKMDFHISLFDDRPGLNTLAKNEFVQEKKIIESYEQIGKYIPSGDNHYVVVMTLGYKFDEIVIRQLFDRDFRYFGVLGSRAKMAVLMRTLLNEGFDKNRLDNIHTPIGLPIKSQTPEEIAISIAAEIIAVKNLKA